VVGLGEMLRAAGLQIGVDAQALALDALAEAGLGNGEETRFALRTVYARSRPAQLIFDEIYPVWLRGEPWRPQTEPATGDSPDLNVPRGAELPGASVPSSSVAPPRADMAGVRYSPVAAPRVEARSEGGRQGLADARRDAGSFLAALKAGEGRRRRPGRRGGMDLRRSLRAAHGTAGEIIRVRRWRRRPRPPRVALLCDFSRSMAGEELVQLCLAEALVRRSRRTEVFAFSTEIRRITDRLRSGGTQSALQGLGFAYGGGTRMGSCLRQFVDGWGERLLGAHSVVVIVSDGLDTGEPQLLREALADLRTGAGRLFWLSPLAGTAGFQPLQGGLRAALPLCDGFGDALAPGALTQLARLKRLRRWQA
jgi:uncharacterized protein with von Willebrand factor type A (vWA) domain